MKKLILFALVLSLLFCMVGCEIEEQETLALTNEITNAEEVQEIAEEQEKEVIRKTAEVQEITEEEGEYIGNLNTKKFHYSSCSHLPYEKNRVYFTEREQATEQYYKPCQICNP